MILDVFRLLLEKQGAFSDWEAHTPFYGQNQIDVRYSGITPHGAIASFWSGQDFPLTMSVLLRGTATEEDERELVFHFQRIVSTLVRKLSLGSLEAGGDLLSIPTRPLIASFPIPDPDLQEFPIVSQLEHGFMAAWVLGEQP